MAKTKRSIYTRIIEKKDSYHLGQTNRSAVAEHTLSSLKYIVPKAYEAINETSELELESFDKL